MTRCKFAGDGCDKYEIVKRATLIANGRADPLDMGSLGLTGIDMEPPCQKAGLPCYNPYHENAQCFHEAQQRKRNQPEEMGELI